MTIYRGVVIAPDYVQHDGTWVVNDLKSYNILLEGGRVLSLRHVEGPPDFWIPMGQDYERAMTRVVDVYRNIAEQRRERT